MYSALQRQPIIRPKSGRVSLSEIARLLDVPVIIASYFDVDGVRNHATFGLDFGFNWSEFAAAVDAQCIKGAKIIPNVESHELLNRWSGSLINRGIRFMVGIPLCDSDGWKIGSIAVIADQKEVARNGIPIRRLGELGREFAGIKA
jgi:hypothetical protein